MPNELSFRIALIVVIVLTTAVTLYHRHQAKSSGEINSQQKEGLLYTLLLTLASLGLWISTLGYLFIPQWFAWAMFPLPDWVRWVGVASGACCSLLMWWTLSSLGRNLTSTAATRKDATLVTNGPYHWVRHPYYVTAALLMASVTVLTANWLIGVSSLAVLFLLAIRTPKEEQMLIESFGDEYRKYMARTGRFFPWMPG